MGRNRFRLVWGAIAILALFIVILLVISHSSHPPVAPPFDGESAFSVLTAQCDLGPRVPGTEAHRRGMELISGWLRRWTTEVELQEIEGVDGRGRSLAGWNIAGTFPGRDPPLLLGAHWDCRAWADQDPDPARRESPVPGANDGASGVAVLMELARLISSAPPERRIVIVLFDLEDQGRAGEPGGFCLGSRRFASHFPFRRGAEAIIVDMVGAEDLTLYQEGYSRNLAPEMTRVIWGLARSQGIGSFSPAAGPDLMDDHVPFLRAGWAAVDIVDLRYPYWHTVEDTPDKCSPASLAAVGEVLSRFIYR